MFFEDFKNENPKDIYYSEYRIKKRPGEYREICAPSKVLKEYQNKVKSILETFPVHKFALGFKKKAHLLDGPVLHKNCKAICNMDIKNFFPSITKKMFINVLEKDRKVLDYIGEENLETMLDITFKNGRLPQGSPASPVISNMILTSFDVEITEYITKLNEENPKLELAYSRYADDITVTSGDPKFNMQIIADLIRCKIKQIGKMMIKERKTVIGTNELKVTGIPINAYERSDEVKLEPFHIIGTDVAASISIQLLRKKTKDKEFLKKGKQIGYARVNCKTRQKCREMLMDIKKARKDLKYKDIQVIAGLLTHILDINPYYAYKFLGLSCELFMVLLNNKCPLAIHFRRMITKKIIDAIHDNCFIKNQSKCRIHHNDDPKIYTGSKPKCMRILYTISKCNDKDLETMTSQIDNQLNLIYKTYSSAHK